MSPAPHILPAAAPLLAAALAALAPAGAARGCPSACGAAVEGMSFPVGQRRAAHGPLFLLAPGEFVQEFAAAPDLAGWAMVVTPWKVKAHLAQGPGSDGPGALVVHNGREVGTCPEVAPFSLALGPGGASVSYTVVKWRAHLVPLAWVVRDGAQVGSPGWYTEEVELAGAAAPWFAPSGGKLAFLTLLPKGTSVVVDGEEVFVAPQVTLAHPWSGDGAHLAWVAREGGADELVVDGKVTARAPRIRLVAAPATYVAAAGGRETLHVEGKECISAAAVREVVLGAAGESLAVVTADGDGALAVTLMGMDCSLRATWGEGAGWTDVRRPLPAPSGQEVFFVARDAAGTTTAHPFGGAQLAGCAGSPLLESVAWLPDSSGVAWLARGGGGDTLCLGGAPLAARERIEQPLVVADDGSTAAFFAWTGRTLYEEEIELKGGYCVFHGEMK